MEPRTLLLFLPPRLTMPPYRPPSLSSYPSDDDTDVLDQAMNRSSPPPRSSKTSTKKAQGQSSLPHTRSPGARELVAVRAGA
ncbi:hypothetical protein DFH09DRAFT_1336845 [Mycena vulgaris]|nr:hypothetical protein DFH09DRAFT_1336845 [Mycena vulgaris]